MKLSYIFFGLLLLTMSWFSCETKDPNLNERGNDELQSLELDHKIDKGILKYEDIIYVPIYSDIYLDAVNQNSLLSATLSIRNTSEADSLFISRIDYFNTSGVLVRKFIENPISLPPMATVNYVVEKEDNTGGSGANFMVDLSAKNPTVKPLIQAIMIGENANKGFAFLTDGYSVKANR